MLSTTVKPKHEAIGAFRQTQSRWVLVIRLTFVPASYPQLSKLVKYTKLDYNAFGHPR
jgi:hypothetical protein